MKIVFKLPFLATLGVMLALLSCEDEDVERPRPEAKPPSGEVLSIAFPTAFAVEQDVYTIPLIVFDYTPEGVYPAPSGEERFRLILDEAFLKTDVMVSTTMEWSADKDSLRLIPDQILEPNTHHSITVKTHWEMDNGDGVWEPVASEGKTTYLTKESGFTTKDFDLTRISSDYIEVIYPVPNQLNLLKSEYNKGYTVLNSGLQNYLFQTEDGSRLVARFTSQAAGGMEVALGFDESTLTLSHDIPADLANETIYRLQYLRIPADGGPEQELYLLHFRTSKFDTFVEKMNEVTYSQTLAWENPAGKTELYEFVENQTESFDFAETRVDSVIIVEAPVYYSVGLIRFEALPGNAWYDEKIYPLVYSEFESSGLRKLVEPHWDRPSTLPVPPLNGLYIRKKELSSDDRFINFDQLTDEDIESDQTETTVTSAEIVYNMANLVYKDYQTFRGFAGQVSPQTAYTQTLRNTQTLSNLTNGEYNAKIKYVLPGKTEATSEVEFTFLY